MTVHADRRQFMTWSAGGAFMLAIAGEATAQPPAAGGNVSPWFKINPNGRVTVFSKAVEMGQGSHTGHASILADELDVPYDMVDVEMADINTYSDTIFTGGSRSIQSTFKVASEAGATARAQFVSAAAKQWGVDPSQCETGGGKVVNKATKASLSYGQLAGAAGSMPAPAQISLKPASSRACIGKDMPTQRGKLRSTGKEMYGIDVRQPGMLRASIIQSPVYGAKLTSLDEAPAMAIPGVVKVVKLDNAVAVIAKDTWTAFKGVRALKPQWSTPELRANSKDYVPQLHAANKAAIAAPATGAAAELRTAYDQASKKVEGSYTLTRVSHVTMEPQNATVHIKGDTVEVWAPTQVPSSVKRGAAAWAGNPKAKIVLHTTMLGGGYGRRLQTDYVEQAVRVAAAAGIDAPIQLVWTREEDFGHDVYRTAVHQTYRAGLKPDGTIDGYETVTVAADTQIRGGMAPAPYGKVTKHAITQAAMVKTGVPFGAWRSVDEGISTWGRESFIDECAIAAGKDPVAYRISLLGDDLAGERGKRLLQAVADHIGWNKPKAPGVGRGVALGVGFNSMAAHAVEVEVKGDTVKVTRIVAAGDLGTVVAPNQVRAQFEGGALMALGTALNEGMTFTDGKADQSNFGAYSPLRHHQAPKVEVVLFDHPKAPVGGSGEPPIPTLAPALANAIANATGKRVRSLPIKNEGFKV
ncbi:MAG TPA: molybdopterin cofactor-binding domain-containing protein [Caulobacteraceae bacterium]|nr:molybdopterin cofactor-binding domain-containing protein [Caulobacteraceae bacterium]